MSTFCFTIHISHLQAVSDTPWSHGAWIREVLLYLSSEVHSEASSGGEVGALKASVARKTDITMTHMGKNVSFNSYDLLYVLHWFLIT